MYDPTQASPLLHVYMLFNYIQEMEETEGTIYILSKPADKESPAVSVVESM